MTESAQDLVDRLLTEPWGRVSPSVYETGRVVSLTPWLAGHAHRLTYLLETQRADGGWGAPDPGYALVPTLSAVEALMTTLHRDALRQELAGPVARGLAALRFWLGGALELPDMPAIELIVPYLISLINDRLPERERLSLPYGLGVSGLARARAALTAGSAPEKLLHALEIGGPASIGLGGVRPEATGTIGASPAATAAWLGGAEPDPDDPARRYLVRAAAAGPVPCALPITVFERAWVLSTLIRAGVDVSVPADLVRELADAIGSAGTPAAAGLPPDADTTAVALYSLSLLGAAPPPDPLWAYETETHFCTWPGEQGQSVSTNAHVLEAFGKYARIGLRPDHEVTATKIAKWLRGMQQPDGSWHDRWHVSPLYATACAALALHDFGGPESSPSVDMAVRWVCGTQRPDGSWGHWQGTTEETSYALRILLLTGRTDEPVERGLNYLVSSNDHNQPLWCDKDLYFPEAIVTASVLAALHLGRVRNRETAS